MTMRTLATKIRLSQRAIAWFALASVVILSAAGQSSTSQGSTTTQRPPLLERQKGNRACAQRLSEIGGKQGGGLRS